MNKLSYRVPLYLVILMNFFGFLLLYMGNSYDINVVYVGLGLMLFFVAIYVALSVFKMGDKLLFLIVSMIITIGILMLCRINLKGKGLPQIVWVGVGGIAFFSMYFVYSKVKFRDRLWLLYAGAGFGFFILTVVFGVTVNGATNWVQLGPIGFQPSEITKIVYIMFLACLYSGSWDKPFMKIQPFLIAAGVSLIYVAFLAWQNDWGTILILMAIYMIMMFIYEPRRWFLVLCVCGAVCVAVIGYKFTNQIQDRVDIWLDPWSDALGKGYQPIQARYGIASGGAFGQGLGNASIGRIPEVYNDYIFAGICAEMGVFVGAAMILLFFLLAYRCFKIALKTTDLYNKAVAVGISLMFSLQTFVIIGGVIGLIPLTGITIPFVSSGGTSMLSSFMALGIMQAISAKEESEGNSDGRE